MATSLLEIHSIRRANFNTFDSCISRLEVLEKSGSFSHERNLLIEQLAYQRSEKIFSKILKKEHPSHNIIKLVEGKEKIQAIVEALNTSNLNRIQQKFRELPNEYQHWLQWAVWLGDSLKNKENTHLSDYGKIALNQNLLILQNDFAKIIFIKGKTLVEQLLHYIEEKICIEMQKEIVEVLMQLDSMINSPSMDDWKFKEKIATLPLTLQWEIHGNIYDACGYQPQENGWGEKELKRNPRIITYLKHPNDPQKTILDYHLDMQKKRLGMCEEMRELAEFEKASILYPLASKQEQKNELLKWMGNNPRAWINSLEPYIQAKRTDHSFFKIQENIQRMNSRLYESRGAHPSTEGTRFMLYAPHARQVWVVLTAWGQEEFRLPMYRKGDGCWEVFSQQAFSGRTYLYLIEDCHGKKMFRIDPFSFSTINIQEVNQIQSVVVNHDTYEWGDRAWIRQRNKSNPLENPLSIHEVHVKSWKINPSDYHMLSFRELTPKLIAHCKDIGFTHVELYGVQDHRNRYERGYQISNYFAPYHELGSCDDLKYLIDHLHQAGIGVIIDWIPTHFYHYHESDGYSTSMHELDGTNIFAAEASNWGTLYIDCSKEEACRLLKASALYWIEKMHVDGLRVDAVSQLVRRHGKNIDTGINFLKDLNHTIALEFPGVLKIAEDTEAFPNVTKPTFEGGLGFDLEWAIGCSVDMRNYFRTPLSERTKNEHHYGKILNFLWRIHGNEKMIITHSHDDSDSGGGHYKTLYNSLSHHGWDDRARLSDLKNFFSWQILAPSRGYLIHMGDEFGQPESWYQRFQQGYAGVQWDILHRSGFNLHRYLQEYVKDLNHFYKNNDFFWKKGESGFTMISDSTENAVVAYCRYNGGNEQLAVVHNFINRSYSEYNLPLNHHDPQTRRIKYAYEVFNSNSARYGGINNFNHRNVQVLRWDGNPTYLKISLPGLSTVVLKEVLEST